MLFAIEGEGVTFALFDNFPDLDATLVGRLVGEVASSRSEHSNLFGDELLATQLSPAHRQEKSVGPVHGEPMKAPQKGTGASVGAAEIGVAVGEVAGELVGLLEGGAEGLALGETLGLKMGDVVGLFEGVAEGLSLGGNAWAQAG